MRIPNPESYEHIGYEINRGKRAKYDAILKNKFTNQIKRVPFGMKGMEHFKDKLGHYSHLDHGDEKRRHNWKRRHGKNIDYKFSSAYWASNILW
jgi:hypothetical protein